MTGMLGLLRSSSSSLQSTGRLPFSCVPMKCSCIQTGTTGWTLLLCPGMRTVCLREYSQIEAAGVKKYVNLYIGRLAVCGETGTLNFNFPFTEFLPAEQKISFSAEV